MNLFLRRLLRGSVGRFAMFVSLAVLASLFSLVPLRAEATPAAPSPDGAVPLICGDDLAEELTHPEHRYAAVWVPAGAVVRMYASGEMMPELYVGGAGRAQYGLHATISRGGAQYTDATAYVDAGVIWGPGPYDPVPFVNKSMGTWTNGTGVSQIFGIDFWAQAGVGSAGLDWEVEIDVPGGFAGVCARSANGSELFGPNPSMGQQCPPCTGGTSNSVDTRSGNEHWSMPGVSVPGRGPGLDFQVAYNSLDAGYDGPLGAGWRHTYDMALSDNPDGTRTVFQETGSTVTFTETSPGQWEAPARFDAKLSKNPDGTWKFTRKRSGFFTFGADGRLTKIADRNGHATTLVYTNGNLGYVQDAAGRRLNFTWAAGRITKITDPLAGPQGPRTIEMTYANGNLTGYKDIGGGQWVLGYDGSHRLTAARSPRFTDPAKVWEFHYDAQGRVDWEEDPQNRRTEIHYDDPSVNATKVVEPDGDARVDYYNQDGMRTSVTTGYGTPAASTTDFDYDDDSGTVTATTDGRGKVWTTQYNDADNPHSATKTIDPLGRERSMTYDDFGQILSLTDAEGVTSEWTYDNSGNLEESVAAAGTPQESVTDLVYGDSAHPGDLTKMVDPRGKEWTYTYAAVTGDRLSASDPLGNKTTWDYNNVGWLTSTVSPRGNASGATPANFRSSVEYDKYGAPVKTIDTTGKETLFEYDADGHPTKVTDPDGEISRQTWTVGGQMATEVTGADTASERTVTYTYAADGRMTTWSADPASVWTTDWDPLGRMESQTDPNGKVTSYAYDGAGNLKTVTQPGGDCGTVKVRCVTYQRDDAGQMIGVDYSDPDTGDVTMTYDDNGRRLTQNVAGQGTSTWEWDVHDQIAHHTDASGEETSYAWDKVGNLKELTYPGQTQPVVYGYDDAGRMSAVTDWTGNHTEFGYDANSNLTNAAYPTDTGLVDTWSYDTRDQLDTLTWDRPAGTPLGSIDYNHAPDGLVSSATASGVPDSPASFGYDPRDQLATATGGQGGGSYLTDDRGYLLGTPEGFNTYDPAGQLEDFRPAISVVGTAKVTNALSNTLTMNLPAGVAADDQIFVVATLQAAQSVVTPPVGYTVVAQDSLASGAKVVVYRKTAVGGETSAVVKFSGGSKSLMAIVYRGVESSDPVAANTTATANDTTSLTVPDLTSPSPGTQLMLVTGGVSNTGALTTTPPAGMTNRIAVDNQGAVAGAISDQTLNEAGPVGTKTATFSRVNDAAGVLLALNPEVQTFDYDDRGRRTATTTTAGSTTTYAYDQAGQLVGVNGPTGTPSDDLDGYAYDGDGLRVQAPIEGQDTHFAWARAPGLPLLLNETAIDGNGELDPTQVSSYIYGPGGQVLTRLGPRPDITRVGTASIANSNLSTPTITLTLPAGVKADDQILVAVAHNSAATPTVPAGYTAVGSQTNGTTVTRLWLRTATGDEAATLKITFTSALSAPKSAVMMVYRGVDPADPIVDHDGAINTGTTVTVPSLDPTSAKDHVVAFAGATASGTTPVWTPPTGFTTREEAKAAGIAITGVERDTDTASATGPISFGFTPSTKLAAVGLVLRQAPAGERWYHADHLGSTRILTDERGRVVGKASYTPYGQPVETTGEVSRLGYAGQYTDPDTGLVYLRARYYDPNTSQFLTRDPLLQATQDPYSYTGNNPINRTDPTGLFYQVVVGAVMGGGLNLLGQMAGNLMRGCPALSDINWGSVARDAALGALGGGLMSAASKSLSMALRANKAVNGAAKYSDDIADVRSYVNLTEGGSIRNIGTNATRTEFADTLSAGGWISRMSKDGTVQIFQKDGAKYVLRSKNSSGYPGWTADFTPTGSTRHTLELRLGYVP